SEEAQGLLARAPALGDDAPDLLPLPRIGTYALGRVQEGEPLRLSLTHPPGARGHLPLSGADSPPVGSWVRGYVQGVDIAPDGTAVPLLAPSASVAESLLQVCFDASAQIVPERPKMPQSKFLTAGSDGQGKVTGYAHDWLLPDGTPADGLLISVNGETSPVFARTLQPLEEARKESPIGFDVSKLRVEDFLEHQG
ncbi:unnamed protein product, partial [Symbiodinium sp. CCMP2456]